VRKGTDQGRRGAYPWIRSRRDPGYGTKAGQRFFAVCSGEVAVRAPRASCRRLYQGGSLYSSQ